MILNKKIKPILFFSCSVLFYAKSMDLFPDTESEILTPDNIESTIPTEAKPKHLLGDLYDFEVLKYQQEKHIHQKQIEKLKLKKFKLKKTITKMEEEKKQIERVSDLALKNNALLHTLEKNHKGLKDQLQKTSKNQLKLGMNQSQLFREQHRLENLLIHILNRLETLPKKQPTSHNNNLTKPYTPILPNDLTSNRYEPY